MQTTDTIMVVDDTLVSLNVLADILSHCHYDVRPYLSAKEALDAAIAAPPDLILLDIAMPEMNGYELCEALKSHETLCEIPVLFISGFEDTEAKVKAFKKGGVDYITKPFRLGEVKARIKTHLKLHRLKRELKAQNEQLSDRVAQQVKEILDAQMATIFALTTLAEYRDRTTGGHIDRVGRYCRELAVRMLEQHVYRQIDDRFISNLSYAAAMHDIGKVGISDAILLKPARLTPDEFNIIKTHTVLGAETLLQVHRLYPKNEFVQMGMEVARWHHEKWDASGYPDGIGGDQIPLSARIMAVVDVYDALRSLRPYKKAFSHETAIETIVNESGKQFDPIIINALEASETQFNHLSRQREASRMLTGHFHQTSAENADHSVV